MAEENFDLTLFPEYSTLVGAERNLEEYPLFELKARQRGSKARVFERIIEREDGAALRQTWKVIPSGEYGMPGPVDQDVYLAVLQLLERRGGMPEDGELAFSLYELRKVLRWSDDSASAYRQIRDALVRIQLTGVQSSNAFYSAADEQLIGDSFNIWSVHFTQSRKRGGGRIAGQDRHVLKFHSVFIRNYIAQYLKGLDAEFYWSLRLPLSKRLYRLVDLQRAGGLSWRVALLAVRDQVPLDYEYPSQIKRALKKAHAELMERGFLSGIEYEDGGGVLYRVSPEFARRQKALELSGDPQEMFAIERLMREGVRGDTARELVVSHGAEECLRYADAVGSRKRVRNRAGWLRKAIERGYEVNPPAQQTLAAIEEEPPGDVPKREAPAKRRRPDPDPQAQRLWQKVLEDLAAGADGSNVEVWFEGCAPVALNLKRGALTLSVPTPLAEEYIEKRFRKEIEKSLRSELGKSARLSLKSYG